MILKLLVSELIRDFLRGTILDVECFECVVSDLAWE